MEQKGCRVKTPPWKDNNIFCFFFFVQSQVVTERDKVWGGIEVKDRPPPWVGTFELLTLSAGPSSFMEDKKKEKNKEAAQHLLLGMVKLLLKNRATCNRDH